MDMKRICALVALYVGFILIIFSVSRQQDAPLPRQRRPYGVPARFQGKKSEYYKYLSNTYSFWLASSELTLLKRG